MLDIKTCQKARLSKDPRFDGKFFTAVKTTKIYCRTICPVVAPKEENVLYYQTAIECANAGFRPCLRCRPDSAPNSPAWKGTHTTLERAIKLINQGGLHQQTLPELADKLGITDRYLRQLFKKHLGTSPKSYALYQQCLFAKQLLHQTKLPITQVALASGFNSLRRFNDYFQSQLKLTPTQIRKSGTIESAKLTLRLYYRPPFNWQFMSNLLKSRAINTLEWADENSYGRTFNWHDTTGEFTAKHIENKNLFEVEITLNNIKNLKPVVNNIRRILDLDVDITTIEQDLKSAGFPVKSGIRLPGIWSVFEAGIRAILGQQISVTAATNLVTILVTQLGQKTTNNRLFPTPKSIANSDLSFLKIPNSRKQTLQNLANHYLTHNNPNNPEEWLSLKGIGRWTIDYTKMRGQSQPDIYLGGDLGVKKSMKDINNFTPTDAAPWRSYLTFQLWNRL